MKVSEAMHILRMIQDECEKQHMDGEAEALQMAIRAMNAIDTQPSVQSEPTLEQIEEYCHKRCLVLITADMYGKLIHHSFKTATAQPDVPDTNVGDMISRQAAIMDVESWVAVDEYEKHLQKNVVEWLKEFPPAELGTDLATKQTAQPDLDEWCYSCSEYDAERHCCPRFNRVIREMLKDAQQSKPCENCQEFDCYGCEWKAERRSDETD